MNESILTLKRILEIGDFNKGIKGNLSLTDEELNLAIERTLNSEKSNSISVEITIDNKIKEFENTLHFSTSEEGERIYLLESRLFDKEKGQLIGSYLEVFNSELVKVESYIDDVWSYAKWEVVQ